MKLTGKNKLFMWYEVKNYLLMALTGILGIVSTFQHAFIALFCGFVLNFFMGMGADAADKTRENFSIKKATEGVKLLMFYIVIIFCLYGMTYREPRLSDNIIKWLTYIVSYFYLTNIFRNAEKIFPSSKAVSFIYMFLSTEVFIRLKSALGIKNRNFNNKRNESDENKY